MVIAHFMLRGSQLYRSCVPFLVKIRWVNKTVKLLYIFMGWYFQEYSNKAHCAQQRVASPRGKSPASNLTEEKRMVAMTILKRQNCIFPTLSRSISWSLPPSEKFKNHHEPRWKILCVIYHNLQSVFADRAHFVSTEK